MRNIFVLVVIITIISNGLFPSLSLAEEKEQGSSFDDIWLVSSLNIIESPPYLQKQVLTAEFTIKNLSLRTAYIDAITVAGLMDYKNSVNFTWYRNIVIKPNDIYKYKGNIKIINPGNYNFSVKYKMYGQAWEKDIKSNKDINSKVFISVKENNTKSNQSDKKSELQVPVKTKVDKIIPEKGFKDVKGYWAEDYINELYVQAVSNGFPNGYFYPDQCVTRAEFSSLLCKGLFLKKIKYSNELFQSEQNNWAYDFLSSTYKYFNDKHINANKYDSRAELVHTLVNAMNWQDDVDESIIEEKFKDANKIQKVYRRNIAIALKRGLAEGFPDNTFRPYGAITRAQACCLIYNAQKLGGNSTIYNDFVNVTGITKTVDESADQDNSGNNDDIGDENSKPDGNSNSDSDNSDNDNDNDNNNSDSNSNNDIDGNGEKPVQNNNPDNENPNNNVSLRNDRLEYIFGYDQYGKIALYKTESQAKANVKEITIKVWDFDKSKVNKISKDLKITVNKKIADVVKIIFNNIYNDPEKFPIKSIASYAWRAPMSSGKLSEHNYGTCIDINPMENPYIINGKTIVGDKWEPGKNPYSIGVNSSVMKAFRNYKWGWGGADWGPNSYDYMHFSYLGH